MALLCPDEGEVAILDMALSDTTPNGQVLKLYSNNYTPAEGDTSASFTEATLAGYASKTLSRATWNAASTAAGTTTKTYPQQSWTFTGAQTLYGYWIEEATTGKVLWAEKLWPTGQAFVNGNVLNLDISVELA